MEVISTRVIARGPGWIRGPGPSAMPVTTAIQEHAVEAVAVVAAVKTEVAVVKIEVEVEVEVEARAMQDHPTQDRDPTEVSKSM